MLQVLKQRRDALMMKENRTAGKLNRADSLEIRLKLWEIRSRLLVYGETRSGNESTRKRFSAIFREVGRDDSTTVKNELALLAKIAENGAEKFSTLEGITEFDREMMVKQMEAIGAECQHALELISG